MFIINISEISTLLLLILFTVLIIYLGKETKRSIIPGGVLCVYLILLLSYVIQLVTIQGLTEDIIAILTKCIAIDFVLILITYLGYLWIDDVDAKANKKKSISNDLDWLWGKV